MKRFIVEPRTIEGDRAELTGESFRHVRKVCRMSEGDRIVLCDGRGRECLGTIHEVGPSSLVVRIEETREVAEPAGPDVWLAQGLPKSVKMDLIVQKATELGATRILPFVSERTVGRRGSDEIGAGSGAKVARWMKIATGAARQSGRSVVPRIDEVGSLDEVVDLGRDRGLCLLLWEGDGGDCRRLGEALREWDGGGGALVVVGPEGGFTDAEVARARAKGYHVATLGRRILRTETVSIAVLATMQYVFGDLG